MLRGKGKALLMKLFYKNKESATVALSKFRLQKNVKTGQGPLTVAGFTKLVQQFEETGSLKNRVRCGRPSLRQTRSAIAAAEMETLASESAAGTSSAREASRRLGLPPSSVRNILHGVFNQYPYKLQSCHELLPSDTVEREAFARCWALSKIEQYSSWVFNILWTYEAHFSLHGDVNTHNCRIWATSCPRVYTDKPPRSPKLTMWCVFTGSFIIGPFFFKKQSPISGWKKVKVNAQRYLNLLRLKIVPYLREKDVLDFATLMQEGATLLIQSRNS